MIGAGFLKGAGLATMGALVGAAIPFHRSMPSGFIPEALAASPAAIAGKDGLTILNDRPVNAETPPHLLDDEVTPTSRHFIRNNGLLPDDMDAATWSLTVDGLVNTPLTLSIEDLRSRFEVVTRRLTIECGGNGRALLRSACTRQPVDPGRRRLCGVDRCTTARRCWKPRDWEMAWSTQPTRARDTHLSGSDKLPISRGCTDRKGNGPEQPGRICHERRPAACDERRAVATGHTGLAGIVFAEVAEAHLASRRGARRRQDDGEFLPGSGLPGGTRREGAEKAPCKSSIPCRSSR